TASFGLLAFGSRLSALGFRLSGLGFRLSASGFRLSALGSRRHAVLRFAAGTPRRKPAAKCRLRSGRRWRDPLHRRKMIQSLRRAWQDPTRRAHRIRVACRNLGPPRGAFALQALGAGWYVERLTPGWPLRWGDRSLESPTLRWR